VSGAALSSAGIPLKAWAVFSGQTDLAWLRVLKPGFRHCFLVLQDGRHWLTLDPLATYTELAVQPLPADFDLPGWYRAQDLTVVAAPIVRGHRRPAPLAVFSCVEALKRALGIHDRWLITPFQLYRHLRRQEPDGGDRARLPDGAALPLA
jgi:hypothetical protein